MKTWILVITITLASSLTFAQSETEPIQPIGQISECEDVALEYAKNYARKKTDQIPSEATTTLLKRTWRGGLVYDVIVKLEPAIHELSIEEVNYLLLLQPYDGMCGTPRVIVD